MARKFRFVITDSGSRLAPVAGLMVCPLGMLLYKFKRAYTFMHYFGKVVRSVLWLLVTIQFAGGDASAQTPQPPAPILEANAVYTNYVFLSWNDIQGENLFHIERKIGSDP